MAERIPSAGDIVFFDSPHSQQDSSARRSAVVLSPASYNLASGLMLCCPTTTRMQGAQFEVVLGGFPPCVALANQVNTHDWRASHAAHTGSVTSAELGEIRGKLRALIG